MFNYLKQHHIGCLVSDIEDFKKDNQGIWNENDYSEVFTIKSQDVKVCFVNKTGGVALELVEPGIRNKSLSKMLAKGISYYHLAFTTPCYETSVEQFKKAHYHQLNEFLSEAFDGKRCSFFFHQHLKLIELIEID